MKLSLLAIYFVTSCSAATPRSNLRGISKEEEKRYYDLILMQQVSSVAPSSAPTLQPVVVTRSPTSTPTARPTKTPTKTPTKNPTKTPTKSPVVPTVAPCFFILDNCPESCFDENESTRPLRCTDPDIQRPDCDSLPFPPLESCPLCCPADCELNSREDCSPTPVPTPEPSFATPEPSIEPSPAPSPVPTPCRDLTVLCPEKCWEVDLFDRLPLCVDFGRPDCDTLPFPADGCPTCCPTQCMDAPELGDCTPTPLPTPSPSLEPTQCIPPPGCPSSCGDVQTPNSVCSAECIACPPVSCEVDIGIQETCPSLECGWDVCTSPPKRLEFLFAGGSCSSSDFKRFEDGSPGDCSGARQSVSPESFPSGYSCNDFNGGPPSATQVQTRSWIQVVGGGITYFDGPVRIGTSFNVTSPNNGPVNSQILIRIFEYNVAEDKAGQTLQVASLPSDCNGGNMLLKDKFAASQLVGFQQGSTVSSLFQETKVEYALSLNSNATSLSLSTANIVLLSSGNFGRLSGPQLGNIDVVGLSVPPNQTLATDYTTVPGEDNRVLASFGGVVDGRECFEMKEKLFSCSL